MNFQWATYEYPMSIERKSSGHPMSIQCANENPAGGHPTNEHPMKIQQAAHEFPMSIKKNKSCRHPTSIQRASENPMGIPHKRGVPRENVVGIPQTGGRA